MNAPLKNAVTLSLRVPEPRARPGDPIDFSGLVVPAAGAAPKPDIRATAYAVRDLAFTMVRVLDEANAVLLANAPLQTCSINDNCRCAYHGVHVCYKSF